MNKIIGRLLLFILFVSAIRIPILWKRMRQLQKCIKFQLKMLLRKDCMLFYKRSFAEAEEAGAEAIILDINTPGGFVDAAGQIAKLMDETDLKSNCLY